VPLPDELKAIAGAPELHDWFGHWPSFHDAEIVSLHLNRHGASTVRIHTWEMTNKTDDKGFYVLDKHVVVEFVLENISDLNFGGFSGQNVVFGLTLDRKEEGFLLDFDPCHGLAGTIEAEKLSIRLYPGKPGD
jgi:hypothetical protein